MKGLLHHTLVDHQLEKARIHKPTTMDGLHNNLFLYRQSEADGLVVLEARNNNLMSNVVTWLGGTNLYQACQVTALEIMPRCRRLEDDQSLGYDGLGIIIAKFYRRTFVALDSTALRVKTLC